MNQDPVIFTDDAGAESETFASLCQKVRTLGGLNLNLVKAIDNTLGSKVVVDFEYLVKSSFKKKKKKKKKKKTRTTTTRSRNDRSCESPQQPSQQQPRRRPTSPSLSPSPHRRGRDDHHDQHHHRRRRRRPCFGVSSVPLEVDADRLVGSWSFTGEPLRAEPLFGFAVNLRVVRYRDVRRLTRTFSRLTRSYAVYAVDHPDTRRALRIVHRNLRILRDALEEIRAATRHAADETERVRREFEEGTKVLGTGDDDNGRGASELRLESFRFQARYRRRSRDDNERSRSALALPPPPSSSFPERRTTEGKIARSPELCKIDSDRRFAVLKYRSGALNRAKDDAGDHVFRRRLRRGRATGRTRSAIARGDHDDDDDDDNDDAVVMSLWESRNRGHRSLVPLEEDDNKGGGASLRARSVYTAVLEHADGDAVLLEVDDARVVRVWDLETRSLLAHYDGGEGRFSYWPPRVHLEDCRYVDVDAKEPRSVVVVSFTNGHDPVVVLELSNVVRDEENEGERSAAMTTTAMFREFSDGTLSDRRERTDNDDDRVEMLNGQTYVVRSLVEI